MKRPLVDRSYEVDERAVAEAIIARLRGSSMLVALKAVQATPGRALKSDA